MKRNLSLGILALCLGLAGCGGGGRTVGPAAEDWCHAHWPGEEQERVCFKAIFEQKNPSKFLYSIERGEQIDQEAAALIRSHP